MKLQEDEILDNFWFGSSIKKKIAAMLRPSVEKKSVFFRHITNLRNHVDFEKKILTSLL